MHSRTSAWQALATSGFKQQVSRSKNEQDPEQVRNKEMHNLQRDRSEQDHIHDPETSLQDQSANEKGKRR